MTKRREFSDSALLLALSSTVRERRENLRLSQEEVAHRARLHRTYISDIERGARNLSLKSLVDLARALELSTSELIITAEERLPKPETINVDPCCGMNATPTTTPQLQESLN
ncbi:MAG TPA: helix-turn-helix transcriptional regulator [Candidatus Obscuribacterales bacterium]